ncbi:MAG: histidinol dehydrogenase [Actinomycetota bacterium]|nr:histidinol dehydrogenase [Actinomycetota bacterium]
MAGLADPQRHARRTGSTGGRRAAPDLARRHIAATSLGERGAIVLTGDVDQAVELANRFAPEHLCLLLKDPWLYVNRIRNAGGVFVGEAACEALGDYIAGPSTVIIAARVGVDETPEPRWLQTSDSVCPRADNGLARCPGVGLRSGRQAGGSWPKL